MKIETEILMATHKVGLSEFYDYITDGEGIRFMQFEVM